MPERRTKEQLVEDFAGGGPEAIKNVNMLETIFAHYDEFMALSAKFAGMPEDFLWLTGTAPPVDYTDGDPAATGEGTAGVGSFYTDTAAGKLYINGGTKAEPLWKIVTSA